MRILYISNEDDLKDKFNSKRNQYKFFNYTDFQKEDNIIGMYSRIGMILFQYKPDLIILKFKHPDMINEREFNSLSTSSVVLLTHDFKHG